MLDPKWVLSIVYNSYAQNSFTTWNEYFCVCKFLSLDVSLNVCFFLINESSRSSTNALPWEVQHKLFQIISARPLKWSLEWPVSDSALISTLVLSTGYICQKSALLQVQSCTVRTQPWLLFVPKISLKLKTQQKCKWCLLQAPVSQRTSIWWCFQKYLIGRCPHRLLNSPTRPYCDA